MNTPYSELTNLLPHSKRRALRREYFVRLVTVALMLATFVIIIHGVLLVPAYWYAHAQAAREQADLDRLASSATSAQERAVKAQISAVQTDIMYLGRLGKLPTASGAIRAVLAVPHPSIKLSGFTYTGPSGTSQPQMTVTGMANTRDALRSYVASLGQVPFVSKADLPISAYAKDSNIPFTITLTGSLLP